MQMLNFLIDFTQDIKIIMLIFKIHILTELKLVPLSKKQILPTMITVLSTNQQSKEEKGMLSMLKVIFVFFEYL
jgi:hypothetical protein